VWRLPVRARGDVTFSVAGSLY